MISKGATAMTNYRRLLSILAIAVFTLVCTSMAQAQATRTWVSGVGDDVNPCSRTAPCKTFAGAISKTAAAGEINCIDSGGFGAVTITKSITIDGGGTLAGILASLTNGVIINDPASPPTALVTLRNLSIDGAGNGLNGIRILRAKTVAVENVEIFGFTGNGIDAPLAAVNNFGTDLFFSDVDIRGLTGAASIGITMSAPGGLLAHMDRVRVQRAPTGVQTGNNTFLFMRDSMVNESSNTAIQIQNSAGNPKATLENTTVASSGTGVSVGTSATAFLSQMTITLCGTGISSSGVVQSSGNNRILGNTSDGVTPSIINPK
jgi:hypothetical protein